MQLSIAGLRFGRFELQPHERRLLVDGTAAPLGARALDVLIALAERAGSLVTKDQLMDLVWPDVVVEENNLQAQVSALRKVLGTELIATIPGHGYRFTARVERAEGFAASAPGALAATSTREDASPAARSVSEPSLDASGLIGRDGELRAVDRALSGHRLVTLVGPGGIGKTVLAQACLAGLAERYQHGACLVRLASLCDGASIPGAINEALELKTGGGDPTAALADALRPRAVLIVLDNAEHLVAGVAALAARLLRDCPSLRMLVTSQLPLGVVGEQVLRLAPLPVPQRGVAAAQALNYGAVALFAQRAREADRRFALDDAKTDAVVAICRALDGLPLALEMCAARWPVLGLKGLRDSLEHRFRVLTGGRRDAPQRQRTMHATLDWSHGLLEEDERAVFRRLGVFTGGLSLDAATEVASDDRLDRWAVIEQLASLVARSLVAVSVDDDPPRYWLPETMRAYALERLAESGEEAGVRTRHARAMRSFFCEAYRLQMQGAGADELRTRCEAEFDNAREAFAWALRHDHATAVSLAAHAARFTAFSARRSEALRWLADCQSVIDESVIDDGIAADVRAMWWVELARFRLFYRDPKAPDAARAALALYTALGDEFGQFNAYGALVRSHHDETPEMREAVRAMQDLIARHPEWPAIARLHAAGASAIAANLAEDYELAKHFRREEARLAAEAGNPFAMHAAQTNVVAILRAQSLWHEAIALARELFNQLKHGGELVNAAYAGLHLVACLVMSEQLAEAAQHASDAWTLARRVDLPLMGDTAALLVAWQGRPRAATKLLGHALAHYAARGFPTAGEPADNIARIEAVTRALLDPVTHDSLLALGAKMSDAQVLALIRSERDE